MINAGQDNPNPVYIGDEVDIEISNESSGTSPSKRASVIPIHHHRNGKIMFNTDKLI